MKYVGIVTLYKGTRVYDRGALGMPRTESALEEMHSQILGELMESRKITKIADDIYCRGETVD